MGANVLTTAQEEPTDHPANFFVNADLTTAEGCETVASAVISQLGGVDIIVHVLGGSSSPGGGFCCAGRKRMAARAGLEPNACRAIGPSVAACHASARQRRGHSCSRRFSVKPTLPSRPPPMQLQRAPCRRTARACQGSLSEGRPRPERRAQLDPETEASIALAQRLASQAGVDYEGGKRIIMDSLGGIPLGRPSLPSEVAKSHRVSGFTPRAATIPGYRSTSSTAAIPLSSRTGSLDLSGKAAPFEGAHAQWHSASAPTFCAGKQLARTSRCRRHKHHVIPCSASMRLHDPCPASLLVSQ